MENPIGFYLVLADFAGLLHLRDTTAAKNELGGAFLDSLQGPPQLYIFAAAMMLGRLTMGSPFSTIPSAADGCL